VPPANGHIEVYRRLRGYVKTIPEAVQFEKGAVAFTLNYKDTDLFISRWTSTSVNAPSWNVQVPKASGSGWDDIAPEMYKYIFLKGKVGQEIPIRAPVRAAITNATGLSLTDLGWSFSRP